MSRQILPGSPDLSTYDKILVSMSGGKDSAACFFHLLDEGVPVEKIEFWHQRVDGDGEQFMDWACTDAYCKAFADAFDVPIYFQWKHGGFEREMTRLNAKTAPTSYEVPGPDGSVVVLTRGGTRGKESTRMQFPQVSADLTTRWCSAYLKIDVFGMALRNSERFNNSKVLVVTGERAEESAARSKYPTFEVHRANGKRAGRTVHHWRPVLNWPESQVWSALKRYRLNPHPAYKLGFGRVSCALCIFGNNNQWNTLKELMPEQFNKVASYEHSFGAYHSLGRPKTIHRKLTVLERADAGSNMVEGTMENREIIRQALSHTYEESVIVEFGCWKLPSGAYKETGGPI